MVNVRRMLPVIDNPSVDPQIKEKVYAEIKTVGEVHDRREENCVKAQIGLSSTLRVRSMCQTILLLRGLYRQQVPS